MRGVKRLVWSRAALVGVAVAAPAPALAEVPASPGTGGDVVREAIIDPAFVNVELPVVALHGGNPEDTVVLFDGFELPWLFHPGGVRSLLPAGSYGEVEVLPGGFGVEYGRGGGVVGISSRVHDRGVLAELTPLDLTVHTGLKSLSMTGRAGWNRALTGSLDPQASTYEDLIARTELKLSTRWTLVGSVLYSAEDDRAVTRAVAALHYTSHGWRAVLAASPLHEAERVAGVVAGANGIDTRAEVIRGADAAAGLTNLEWRLGQQTNSTYYDTGEHQLWRHDVGVWSSIGANLSQAIRATAGLRVDDFDGDVATQPRASLLGKPRSDLVVMLAAGAYRRPPRQRDEVALDLNPERATQVAAGATFAPTHGLWLTARAYYTDRTRLVIRDTEGELHNSGFGTSKGVELIARLQRGAWTTALSTAVLRSKRFDYPRAAERPSEYEQPFRLDAIAAWRRGSLVLGARLQLASGLPYTPYPGAIYNSDTDTYEPLYAPPLSARAPFHHEIDLRADYRKRWGDVEIAAFIDLHNAYRNRDAIAYRYSYDYSARTAITALPLFPFAGLRVTL